MKLINILIVCLGILLFCGLLVNYYMIIDSANHLKDGCNDRKRDCLYLTDKDDCIFIIPNTIYNCTYNDFECPSKLHPCYLVNNSTCPELKCTNEYYQDIHLITICTFSFGVFISIIYSCFILYYYVGDKRDYLNINNEN